MNSPISFPNKLDAPGLMDNSSYIPPSVFSAISTAPISYPGLEHFLDSPPTVERLSAKRRRRRQS